ncbi:uncharacterized protein DUF4166 [Sinobacterium caligoides]|uniref:Uncharacterized protein DUF4166 n=1 Tax=Sinobacterium caligoides TaxID=933926 RepID=A0A3N2DKN6_9GAMM|nr:DUF4166 domain-containing protein [Sinobacterium caligoides]ROS00249.1 uncharacterized protein DUF4166 [Sinobacterium caligoides]
MNSLLACCLDKKQFERLPTVVRRAHEGSVLLRGEAKVERGGFFAQLICHLLRLPPARERCLLVVKGEHSPGKMRWNRQFDDHVMNSKFYRRDECLVEQLGPLRLQMRLSVENEVLLYRLRKVSCFGVPIPRVLSPLVMAREREEGGFYRFDVSVSLPVIGLLVSYSGNLRVISEPTTEEVTQ